LKKSGQVVKAEGLSGLKKSGQVVLSRRLQMLADMVTPGNSVADVGCDHAFLSIYLVQAGISPHVLAMDVRKGPLSAARKHIESSGLNTYIESRLSDGLEALGEGEAETIICAGMGGRLMERILGAGEAKARRMRELILQPQSEIKEFRAFLRREGYRILAEEGVYEEGKYYFAMKAVYVGAVSEQEMRQGVDAEKENIRDAAQMQDIFDEYGELMLAGRHPVLKQYLLQKQEKIMGILEKLEAEYSPGRAGKASEFRQELERLETVLDRFYGSVCR